MKGRAAGTVRVVTLNIWQEQGPWEHRLRLTAERLRALEPDVVCLQEVREVAGRIPNQARTLASSLGFESVTCEVAQEWGGGDEGLAIISRLPMVQRDACELPFTSGRSRRVCLGAELGLAGDSSDCSFWIFTTHLAWRMADGDLREQQVLAVESFVDTHRGEQPTILTGDFNAPPDADEIRFLRGRTTLAGKRSYFQDAFASCNPGALGLTWTRENPFTEALSWLEPDRRLDYIFVSPMTRDGAARINDCRVVCTEPDPTGVYCSDHYGVFAEIVIDPGLRRA
jgi:endonuclease/exonuclease/phosphatase family metal-dependent hydrolase